MNVVEGDPRYPSGVVSFTFDDGLASQYRVAFPTLQAYGYPATAYVIRNLIGSQDIGSYMSMDELADLSAHGWEIAAHADLIADHNAYLGFSGISPNQLITDVQQDAAWLSQSRFNGASDIALPQGYFDAEVSNVLKRYGHFTTVRTSDYRSIETRPLANPHRLRARMYDPTEPIGPATLPGSIAWRVERISRFGGWLILGFHDLLAPGGPGPVAPVINEGSAISGSNFQEVVANVAARRVPVRTVGQVWASEPGAASSSAS